MVDYLHTLRYGGRSALSVIGESTQGVRELGVSSEQIRLMVRIARLHHERGMRQTEIARLLHISQTRVSRLLSLAARIGIVRTTVTFPADVHPELEEAIEERYGLAEAIVVDVEDAEDVIVRRLGQATAAYLESTLLGEETLGFSSWSATVLATVDAMRPTRAGAVDRVIQVVGGYGEPRVQAQANRFMTRLADLLGASPVFMPAPGLLETPDAISALLSDRALVEVVRAWSELSVVLFGIGCLEPSPLLKSSGNAMAEADEAELRALGAVGDVCLRFFDSAGTFIESGFNARVAGIATETLRAVPRRIGAAGGSRKHHAIRAAILGGWVNVIITDVTTATWLVSEAPTP